MNGDEVDGAVGEVRVCRDCGMPGECAACYLMRSQGHTPPCDDHDDPPATPPEGASL